MKNSNIEIYKSDDGKTEINVQFDKDTVWLNLNQISALFKRDKSVISRHINNIFKEKELTKKATVANYATVQNEGGRQVKRTIESFNLDIIISVGYRIKSNHGTQFRIWANHILKEYLIKGYAINEKRLKQKNEQLKDLQNTVKILGQVLNHNVLQNDESLGLLNIISEYAYALDILDQYDYQKLTIKNTSGKETYQITYDEAVRQIETVKKTYGNKRIAAFLFLYFLEKNNILYDSSRNKRIADNALVALTLMIAVSKPEEKDTMIKVIVNLINKNN